MVLGLYANGFLCCLKPPFLFLTLASGFAHIISSINSKPASIINLCISKGIGYLLLENCLPALGTIIGDVLIIKNLPSAVTLYISLNTLDKNSKYSL